jgi:hypothetical protein
LHDAPLVDDDHGVRHGVEDRLQMGLAPERGARAGGRAQAIAL